MSQIEDRNRAQESPGRMTEEGRRLLALGGEIAKLLVDREDVRQKLPARFRLTILPQHEPTVAAYSLGLMGARGARGWARVFAVVGKGSVRFVGGPTGDVLAEAPFETPSVDGPAVAA